jgi:hypothetical protein
MRRALTSIVVATVLCRPCGAEERRSWNRVRYIGGTVQVKTSRFDWNTTLTVSPDLVLVEIEPATVFAARRVVRIKPSQILSLGSDEAAWRLVAAVDGAQLPAKHPVLFGMLKDYDFLSLVYETDDGKRNAMLLESVFSGAILRALTKLTGKGIENSP